MNEAPPPERSPAAPATASAGEQSSLARAADDKNLGSASATPTPATATPLGSAVPLSPLKPLPEKPDLRFHDYDELENLPDAQFIVEELIGEQTLVAIYGPPGTFKSFFALGAALSIANGMPFGQRATTKGAVCYVAAEGAKKAFHRRRKAWDKTHGGSKDAPLRPIFSPVQLTDKRELEYLARLILQEEQRIGQKFVLVIIDTLARCFDGEENSAQGMGAAVKACDWLKINTGATVAVVAHTGKDESRGIRGCNAFEGATDTILAVRREEKQFRITVKIERQKDGDEDEGTSYGVKKVELDGGKSSLVIDFSDAEAPVAKEVIDKKAVMLSVLREHSDKGLLVTEWQLLAQVPGVAKKPFYDIWKKELEKSPLVRNVKGRWFAVDPEEASGAEPEMDLG